MAEKITQSLIEQWVSLARGQFNVRAIWNELGIETPENKAYLRVILKRLAEKGMLATDPNRDGFYRVIDKEAKPIDWQSADPKAIIPLKFPFGLEEHVRVYPKSIIILAGSKNAGKGHPYGTPILTPYGWKEINKLEIGEEICHPSGATTKIEGIYYRGEKECYRFIFNDGSSVEVDEDHLWKYQTYYNRSSKVTGHGNLNTQFGKWRLSATKDIVGRLGIGKLKSWNKLMLPPIKPLKFCEWVVPIDPYLLGLLLGDGTLTGGTIRFSTADKELLGYIQELGIKYTWAGKYDYRFLNMIPDIKKLGLYGRHSYDKFIPNQYLWNDKSIRVAVLQGLLDTDGSIDERWGRIEFSTTSYQLALDVKFLVQSLGGIATIKDRSSFYSYRGQRKQGRQSYRVKIRIDSVNPFRLKRKARHFNPQYAMNKLLSCIEAVGSKPTICIKVANPDGLYIAKDFIVTHNTAWLYNFIVLNMNTFKIDLFNSETGAEQMNERFSSFDIPTPAPFNVYERYDNFADVIHPDHISVIDYLDLNSEVYLIGAEIDAIFRKINGVAVIGLQKPPPSVTFFKGVKKVIERDLAYGGGFTAKRAILYISMGGNKLKLVYVKTPASPTINPNNMIWTFSLNSSGSHFENIERYYGEEL